MAFAFWKDTPIRRETEACAGLGRQLESVWARVYGGLPHPEDSALALGCALLHCADLGHPTMPWGTHQRVSLDVCREFYAQSQEEKRLGLASLPCAQLSQRAYRLLECSKAEEFVTMFRTVPVPKQ